MRCCAERVDVFAYGQSRHLLELNHRVLCGVTPESGGVRFARRRLAGRPPRRGSMTSGEESGIGELRRLGTGGPHPAARRGLAAGAFVDAVSTPQLFVEGNRRTALLVASYLLARGGLPPVVVRAAGWPAFEAVADRVVAIDRRRRRDRPRLRHPARRRLPRRHRRPRPAARPRRRRGRVRGLSAAGGGTAAVVVPRTAGPLTGRARGGFVAASAGGSVETGRAAALAN